MTSTFILQNKSKKSQITVFIILGIIILLFSSLFYYILSQKSSFGSAQDEKIQEILKSGILIEYTKNCLQSSLQAGLMLIGSQGGYIYKDQPGSILTISVDSVLYENIQIPYLIKPISSVQVPQFPCLSSGDPAWHCNFSNNISLFPNLYSYRYGDASRFLELDYIKKELKSYIELKIKECANFSELQSTSEFTGIEITEESLPFVNLIFGPDDVSATLKYPIIISSKEGKTEKEIIEAYSTENVRLKKIHAAVKDILEKDNIYLNYHIKEDTQTGEFFLENINGPERKELAFDTIKDKAEISEIVISTGDIIQISDSGSNLLDAPYLFQFARKNRYPALDFIKDMVKNETQIFELSPKAADPDEDELSFVYDSSWRIAEFQQSQKGYTSFVPQRRDIGLHNIKLSVSDSEYSDYQTFDIQVCGLDSVGILPDICLNICNSSIECDNKQKGLLPTNFINRFLMDKCNETCRYVSSNICSPNANFNCNTRQQYYSSSQGWCYGLGGCELWCTSPESIVDSNFNNQLDQLDQCSCATNFQHCDSYPYNFNFRGYCQNNVCVGDS